MGATFEVATICNNQIPKNLGQAFRKERGDLVKKKKRSSDVF